MATLQYAAAAEWPHRIAAEDQYRFSGGVFSTDRLAHLLPRLSLEHSESLSTLQLRSLRRQSLDDEQPLPLAISSYDFTIYNLSLPNNRPNLLEDALVWLSDITGKLALNEHGVQVVMSVCIDPVGTFPLNLQDAWRRCRLKGSTLAAQDPAQPVKLPVSIAQLNKLFAAYAHTGTDVLMSQRLGSQQRGGVGDITLEQYQRLPQTFLFGLTFEALNWELKLQLSQDVALALKHPEGGPEMSMKQLQETCNSIMSTASCGGESGGS